MNEELNLVEVLKDCPKGTKLYSLIRGECTLVEVSLDKEEHYPIVVMYDEVIFGEIKLKASFTANGKFTYDKGECVLFPSKDCRDWSKFNTMPATWEKFCKTHPLKGDEVYVSTYSEVCDFNFRIIRNPECDKIILPNKKYAKAMIALCQLIQLRDCYNDGWQPDWTNHNEVKYSIYNWCGCVDKIKRFNDARILSFKSEEIRDKFYENFRDLIEIAKPLL